MISDRNKAIFVHVPRVAGTSIEMAITGMDWWNALHLPGVLIAGITDKDNSNQNLNAQFDDLEKLGKLQPKHFSAEDICLYHEQLWSTYFTFAFTRNPWDRLLSLYASLTGVLAGCMVKSATWWPWQKFVVACFEERNYLDKNNKLVNFSKFVRRYQPMPWETDHKTQTRFLQPQKGFRNLDFIGRFENLEKDFEFVCNSINFPSASLEKGNSSKRGAYKDYYDSATKDFVTLEYAEDIDNFKYTF